MGAVIKWASSLLTVGLCLELSQSGAVFIASCENGARRQSQFLSFKSGLMLFESSIDHVGLFDSNRKGPRKPCIAIELAVPLWWLGVDIKGRLFVI